MGNLKPGIPLTYESPDGGKTVYSREPGSPWRTLVGYSQDKKELMKEQHETELWKDIRKEAENNPALQKALDHAKLIYYTGKDYGT